MKKSTKRVPAKEQSSEKLYFIRLKGCSSIGAPKFGYYYVIARGTEEAYKKVRDFCDKEDIGFESDRELKSIELIADSYRHTKCDYLLLT